MRRDCFHRMVVLERFQRSHILGQRELDAVDCKDLAIGEHVGVVRDELVDLGLFGNALRALRLLAHELDEQRIAQLALAQQIIGGLVEALVACGLRQQAPFDHALECCLLHHLLVDAVGNVDVTELGVDFLKRDFLAIDDGGDLAGRLLVAGGKRKTGQGNGGEVLGAHR